MSSAPASATPAAAHAAPASRWGGRYGRYVLACCCLACFLGGQGAYLFLSAPGRASLLGFASTSVANLTRDPLGCLAASVFVTGGNLGSTLTWLPLMAVALCGAARAAGPWRALGVAAAGHVIGTVVSEGLVAWRISTGALPGSDRFLTDVGPSYVVVSSLVLTMVCLPWSRRDRAAWTWRILAVLAMLLLIFPGHIYSGLFSLDVAAVGHMTATAVAAITVLGLRRRPQPATVPPTAIPIR